MKNLGIILLLLVGFSASAQKKKTMNDIKFTTEGFFVASKALGNNNMSKNFAPFYGFGFSGQLHTPINWGLGIQYSLQFSDVKNGKANVYGDLGSAKMNIIDLNIFHRNQLGNEFYLEKAVGYSVIRLNSIWNDGSGKYTEGKGGIHASVKGIYTIDREEKQHFIFGLKAMTYSAGVHNENKEIEKFYNRSYLISLSLGYRYSF